MHDRINPLAARISAVVAVTSDKRWDREDASVIAELNAILDVLSTPDEALTPEILFHLIANLRTTGQTGEHCIGGWHLFMALACLCDERLLLRGLNLLNRIQSDAEQGAALLDSPNAQGETVWRYISVYQSAAALYYLLYKEENNKPLYLHFLSQRVSKYLTIRCNDILKHILTLPDAIQYRRLHDIERYQRDDHFVERNEPAAEWLATLCQGHLYDLPAVNAAYKRMASLPKPVGQAFFAGIIKKLPAPISDHTLQYPPSAQAEQAAIAAVGNEATRLLSNSAGIKRYGS